MKIRFDENLKTGNTCNKAVEPDIGLTILELLCSLYILINRENAYLSIRYQSHPCDQNHLNMTCIPLEKERVMYIT